jgi:hypothetical protein
VKLIPFFAVVAGPVFDTEDPGTREFEDSAGRPWVLHGDAAITSVDEIIIESDPGPPWVNSTDHPEEFPFRVVTIEPDSGFAIEEWQVTAIDGDESPQTFTVVRGVNGVHTTLVAGTPVRLARLGVIAL